MYETKDISILDVGCGYGRKASALNAAGFNNVLGVDTNETLIGVAKKSGVKCVHYNELDRSKKYDVILMSHIIEHFETGDLVPFIDSYLDVLKVINLRVNQ